VIIRRVTGRPKGKIKTNKRGELRPSNQDIYGLIYREWLKTDPLYKKQDRLGRAFLEARTDRDRKRDIENAITNAQLELNQRGHVLGEELLKKIWKEGRRADRGDEQ
jgi:hypothetical protein